VDGAGPHNFTVDESNGVLYAAYYNAGVIAIAREGEPFSREDRELLEYLAGQAVISIENTDLHQTVQRQAVTDELTGLGNRRRLFEYGEQRLTTADTGDRIVLMLIDLDDFTAVNDAPITVAGDGSQTRSVCYVDDLVDGVVAAADADARAVRQQGSGR
jgi:predicted signal transduction protein with EAL and GGDEF domain